jgi:hypothetical protein
VEVFSCEQRSDEWFRLHMGIPTGSEFHKVMAKKGPRGGESGKEYVMRAKYMRILAGEIITGEPRENEWGGNRHTERGKEREDEARCLYALDHDVEPVQVGFVRNGNCGCSPDSFVGTGGLELKDVIAEKQIERLKDGTLPSEHKWQVIGGLLVCEQLEFFDFMSHCRGLPPFYVRTWRDKVTAELAELRAGIDRFCEERDFLVKWVKAMA